MTTRRRVPVVLALVAVCSLAGCVQQPRACTEIGAANGVAVEVVGLVRSEQLDVEVCLDGQCVAAPMFADGPPETFVELPGVDSVAERTYRVTVRTPEGTVVVPSQEVVVAASRVQPNGEGCPPTAYQARISVRP
jgi:hypothetical protein